MHEPEDFVKFKSAFHEEPIERQWEESSEPDTSEILKDLKEQLLQNEDEKPSLNAPTEIINTQLLQPSSTNEIQESKKEN